MLNASDMIPDCFSFLANLSKLDHRGCVHPQLPSQQYVSPTNQFGCCSLLPFTCDFCILHVLKFLESAFWGNKNAYGVVRGFAFVGVVAVEIDKVSLFSAIRFYLRLFAITVTILLLL
jgi:hypothetical protein